MSMSQVVFLLEPLLHDPQRITEDGFHDSGGFYWCTVKPRIPCLVGGQQQW